MKVSRLATVLLSLVFFVSLMTGCGGGDNPAKDQQSTEVKTEPAGETKLNDAKSIFSKATEIKCMSYNMTITTEGMPETKSKFWVKGNKVKMQGAVEGMGEMIFYSDTDKKVAFNYIPSEKIATKIDYSQAEAQQGDTPLDYSKDLDGKNFKEVGNENVNGYDCVVYEVSDEAGTNKIWVTKEYGIPAKVESKIEGKLAIINFADISTSEIPDSEFELPTGTQVMDMNNMMQNIPKQ